jgi:hypothetical protein
VVLGVGIALLYGRYDWGLDDGRFAKRGFALSAYLLVILLPTCFYLARRVLHDAVAAAGATAFVFVVTTLPYRLLGLDSHYYYRSRPQVFGIDKFPPSLQFLPGGTLRAFPYDWLFMPVLFATGAALIWSVWWLRTRARLTARRIVPVLLTVAFAAICVQSFMHSSMRAPYTYLAYFQRPEADQHWYHVYHFADGSGASEADQFAFSPLEDYFQGAPRDGDNELIRRPFSFYLASQVSYFVNTFYVWLGLNCLFWLAAVVATARLATRFGNERAGIIAGALTTFGPGFVAFVATPAMYLQNYAAVAVALCLFEELVVRPDRRRLADVALFTAALTLCALVYDLTPLLVVLLVYGLARRVGVWVLVASLGAAFLATRGFTAVVTDVLDIHINPNNARQLSLALERTRDYLLPPNLSHWYDAVITVVPNYVGLLLQAFFVVPLVLAVVGLSTLHDKALRTLVAALLAMGLVIVGVFQLADLPLLGLLPRLTYPVFPAVYLLAAMALDWIATVQPVGHASGRLRVWTAARRGAPWAVIALMAVLVNVDIFGYPTLYVEYFVHSPPVFLP